jgi:hypothetical protein
MHHALPVLVAASIAAASTLHVAAAAAVPVAPAAAPDARAGADVQGEALEGNAWLIALGGLVLLILLILLLDDDDEAPVSA